MKNYSQTSFLHSWVCQLAIACRCLALTVCLLAAWLLMAPVQAQELQSAHFKVLRFEKDVRVHANGTDEWQLTIERLALSDSGAVMIGKYAQSYIQSTQTLEIQEAYTLKANGEKVGVKPEDVQRQLGVASAGVGMSWPDAAILQVTWPNLQKGDRGVVVLKGSSRQPVLPGWLSDFDVFPSTVDFERARLRLEVPQGMDFQVKANGMDVRSHASGQNKVWEVNGSFKARFRDVGAVNINTTLPSWSYSSFSQWERLGAAFGEGFQAKLTANSKLKTLAEQVIQGEATAEGKARKIHQWMRENIRYVAVFLGVGGWVPHDLDWILDNRYGDCKDQSLLMIAMLQAVGVQASPVLLRAQPDHDLPPLAVPWFDHCIVFISELGLYVDPTATQVGWGDLPVADRDKPALIAATEARNRLDRTPAIKSTDNRIELSSSWQIHGDGSARVAVKVKTAGNAAVWLQNQLRQVTPELRQATLSRWLQASGLRGNGDMHFSPINVDARSQDLEITTGIKNLLPNPDAGAVNLHPMLNALGLYIVSNLGNVSPEPRDYAVQCMPMSIREEFEVRFDRAFKLVHVPGSAKVSDKTTGISFEQDVQSSGNFIRGSRQLVQNQDRHTCSPEQHKARQPSLSTIWRRLNGNILFTQDGL